MSGNSENEKAHFLRVYDTYADSIFRFCFLKVSDEERALDLTQEVFMKFWQVLREGKEIRNDRAFLYTIARNLIIDWYRKKKEASLDTLVEEDNFQVRSDGHEQVYAQAEVREVLDVIARFDPETQELLILRYVEGLPPREIADILNEEPNVISVRLNRAVKKVRARMQEPLAG